MFFFSIFIKVKVISKFSKMLSHVWQATLTNLLCCFIVLLMVGRNHPLLALHVIFVFINCLFVSNWSKLNYLL